MSTTFNASLRLALLAVQRNLLENSTPVERVQLTERMAFADGEGTDQAEEIWHDERAIGFGATDGIDLNGGIVSTLTGAVLSFTKIKALILIAHADNPNNLEITMPADGIPFLKTAADAVLLGADDLFVLTRRAAAGIVVGAGATDQLDIVNPGGSGSCTYQVFVIGTK